MTHTNIETAGKFLTVPEAIKLHDDFASRSELGFNFFYDGCSQRTHLMGIDKECEGLSLKKAWAFAQKRNYLTFTSPSGFTQKWHYHMALCLPVEDLKFGVVRDFIFDPALFDGPVLLGKWRKAFYAPHMRTSIHNWGEFPRQSSGDFTPAYMTNKNTTKQSRKVLEAYGDSSSINVKTRIVLASPLKKEFAKSVHCPDEYLKLHKGNGWMSEVIYKKIKPNYIIN